MKLEGTNRNSTLLFQAQPAQAIHSNARKFVMSMCQIFLPDDVKYSCLGADGLKKFDDLVRLERDEWLEFKSPERELSNERFVYDTQYLM